MDGLESLVRLFGKACLELQLCFIQTMYRLPQELLGKVSSHVDAFSAYNLIDAVAGDTRYDEVVDTLKAQSYLVAIQMGRERINMKPGPWGSEEDMFDSSECYLDLDQCPHVVDTLSNISVKIAMTSYDYSPICSLISKIDHKVQQYAFCIRSSDVVKTIAIPVPEIHHKITKLRISCHHISQQDLSNIFINLTNLNEFALSSKNLIVVDIPSSSNLLELTIMDCSIELKLLPTQLKVLKLVCCDLDAHCRVSNLQHLVMKKVTGNADFMLSLILESKKSLIEIDNEGYARNSGTDNLWDIVKFEASFFRELRVVRSCGPNFGIIRAFPNLQQLSVNLTSLISAEQEEVSDVLAECSLLHEATNLSHLSIYGLLPQFIDHFDLPPNIKSLTVKSLAVQDPSNTVISLDSVNFQNLKNLTINFLQLKNVPNIPRCIEYLDLSFNCLTTIPSFEHFPHLKTLLLQANRIELPHIRCPNLSTVDLSQNGAKQVVLPRSIESLNLMDNFLSTNEVYDCNSFDGLSTHLQTEVKASSLPFNRSLRVFNKLRALTMDTYGPEVDDIQLPNGLNLFSIRLMSKMASVSGISWNSNIANITIEAKDGIQKLQIDLDLFKDLEKLETLLIYGLQLVTSEQNPLCLPLNLRHLTLKEIGHSELHLQFPPGEASIRTIDLLDYSLKDPITKYNLYTLGHKKNGCVLNKLECIFAEEPPSDENTDFPPNLVYIENSHFPRTHVVINYQYKEGVNSFKFQKNEFFIEL